VRHAVAFVTHRITQDAVAVLHAYPLERELPSILYYLGPCRHGTPPDTRHDSHDRCRGTAVWAITDLRTGPF
jgi:hypothetical protein